MSHNDYIEQAAPGFKGHGAHGQLPGGRDGGRRARPLRSAVPSRSAAHGRGQKDAAQLCLQCVRLRRRLEDGLLCGEQRKGPAGADRRRQGAVRPVRRRGFLGAGGHAGQGGGKQLTCVFVDHGLLRKNEKEEVCAVFGPGNPNFDINFVCVTPAPATSASWQASPEPERKRKIIGEEFIRVFEEEAKKIGHVDFLAQGTIYPDVVESGLGGESTVIKSHHNVGGLPDHVDFKALVEPLRNLFKDEVRL